MKVNTNAPLNSGNLQEKANIEKKAGVERSQAAGQNAIKPSAAAIAESSQVEISDHARLLQRGVQAVRSMPDDIRGERVAQLKKSISQGTYQVDSKDIADKLVDEHVQAHLGKNSL